MVNGWKQSERAERIRPDHSVSVRKVTDRTGVALPSRDMVFLEFLDHIAYLVHVNADLGKGVSCVDEHEDRCGQSVVDRSFGGFHDGIPSFQM